MPLSSRSAAGARRATLLLAPLLLLAGCARTIVDADVSAEVRGRILRAGGAPVPGAEVRAHVLDPTCTREAHPTKLAKSDAQGHYSLSIATFGTSREHCLRLEVLPPAGSGLAPATVADRQLDLLPGPGGVLEIDVQLSPATTG
jgi:hypothetical protein